MPLQRPEDFGTDAAGYRVNDFCRHCFTDGAFVEPFVTMPQMLERCVSIMAAKGIMTAPKARALMEETLPRLKRWNVPVAGVR
jgi:hypothetical protein